MQAASTFVTYAMAGLALGVAALTTAVVVRTAQEKVPGTKVLSFVGGVVLWMAASAGLGLSGFLRDATPPRPLALLLPTVLLPTIAAFSPVGTALVERLGFRALIALQIFRLPLELVMHRAATEGTMPMQMSYSGWNFDIVTGLSALLLVALFRKEIGRPWAIAHSVMGTVLLASIVAIAIASLPAIALFGPEPERLNEWVAEFPFVWLPAALVGSALFFHLVTWRKILRGAGPNTP